MPTYTIKSKAGRVVVGLPSKWSTRIPHLFSLEREGRSLSPDVEINIPLKPDARVSGVYVRSGSETWLCSRGKFTAYRGAIPKDTVLRHFGKWVIEVVDGDGSASVIPVTSLSSTSLRDDIATFIKTVIDLKTKYKTGGDSAIIKESNWNEGKEPEGKTKGKWTKIAFEYDYLHGPLCNALQEILTTTFDRKGKIALKRNKHVDLAMLRKGKPIALFEVKTSAGLGEQLDKAVGQFFYYRHRYASPATQLFLVLPSAATSATTPHRAFLKSLGIRLLFCDLRSLKSADGSNISTALASVLT